LYFLHIGLNIITSGSFFGKTFVVWYQLSIVKIFSNGYKMGKAFTVVGGIPAKQIKSL